MSIEHACMICAMELLKDDAILAAELRVKGDFLDELLNWNQANYSELNTKAVKLGYDFNQQHQIVVIEIGKSKRKSQMHENNKFEDQVIEDIKNI